MEAKLKSLQDEISDIDIKMLNLLNQRASTVKTFYELKNGNNANYFDPIFEQQMMEQIFTENKGPLSNEVIIETFKTIFSSWVSLNKCNRKLIVNSDSEQIFKSINEMFELPTNMPIIIAGPCSVENYEYLEEIANVLNKNKVRFLRGGAYKPRTSPYDFQGLGRKGLEILSEVSRKYNLISVTEVIDTRDVDFVTKYSDIMQVGARNMQNFELLKEVGQTKKPVILKRGINATVHEFILAAEYIALQGNRNIILCERGIRTFETKTRNTLDISSIPIIKNETRIPIIADLSHSLGRKDIVNPIAKSVFAVGGDGIMVEVHPKPELALSDSKQQLSIEEFGELLEFLGINND